MHFKPAPVLVPLAAAALVLAVAPPARAFGEEPGAELDGQGISTHHTHLTRALAACAGIPVSGDFHAAAVAETIALNDELTDATTIGTVTNCKAAPYTVPTAAGLGCASGTTEKVVWPLLDSSQQSPWGQSGNAWDPKGGCFSSRFGPYSGLFHFPTDAQLTAMKTWATTPGAVLAGETQWAFGGNSLYGAECYKTRAEPVDSGAIKGGSPEALGIYLHARADWWSHKVCRDNWGTKAEPPWYTHTLTQQPEGCPFTQHTLELGCPLPAKVAFVQHTIEAAREVYGELVEWSKAHASEAGYKAPLTTSFSTGHQGWLLRQVQRFATEATYAKSADRMAFADQFVGACDTYRATPDSKCLPDLGTPAQPPCATLTPIAACDPAKDDAGTGTDASGTDAVASDTSPAADASGSDGSAGGAGAAGDSGAKADVSPAGSAGAAPSGAAPPAEPDGGCGCSTGPRHGLAGFASLAALGCALLARRRRR
jgi:hypothetical protein